MGTLGIVLFIASWDCFSSLMGSYLIYMQLSFELKIQKDPSAEVCGLFLLASYSSALCKFQLPRLPQFLICFLSSVRQSFFEFSTISRIPLGKRLGSPSFLPILSLRDHITMLLTAQCLITAVSSGRASPVLVTPSQWEEVSHAVLICIFQMFTIHNVANKRQNLCLSYILL